MTDMHNEVVEAVVEHYKGDANILIDRAIKMVTNIEYFIDTYLTGGATRKSS